jgi:gamma-glutamyltranspeptidase/glutathione hydrolase
MVATSQPLAVDAGLAVLREGGNAVDAAIAANAVLSVVEPMSCGPGGDLFALVWDASDECLFGLNGSGRAPRALSIESFRRRNLSQIPSRGPLSWTVPGCVEGWERLHERLGASPWQRLFAPAIDAAESGFSVTPVIGAAWKQAEEMLRADPGSSKTFLIDGKAPSTGARFRNPRLAEVLRQVAEDGADSFYRGSIGQRLAGFSQSVGAALSAEDLVEHRSTWIDPIALAYRGYRLWELPPNSQGVVALEMLNILSGFDLTSLDRLGPDYLHLLIEAKKLAYENRARGIADPDFASSRVSDWLLPEHGARQRRRIDPLRAARDVQPSTSPSDTVYITAVDKKRNAVSLIQSIYRDFGSAVTPPDLGFALQNRGTSFSLDPQHANCLEPGKRPFHTIIPAMLTKGGRPVFSFGVMGGDMQPQGQVQVLLNLLVFGLDPQQAGAAPRMRHDGSSSPTGNRMEGGGQVHLEPGFPAETVEELKRRGHQIRIERGGYGGYQGIWIDETTELLGGSDPRKDGCAKGL